MRNETSLERIFKVTTNVDGVLHKYVFVGKVPGDVGSILSTLERKEDLTTLSTDSARKLRSYFGDNWEFSLGIYTFHTGTVKEDKNELTRKLQASGIDSYATFKRAMRQNNPTLGERDIARGKARFAEEINREYGRYTSDRLHFVKDFPIRYDDNIKIVRQKIYLVCTHLKYYIRPEWQHLFTANDKNLSTETFQLQTSKIRLSSNPLDEIHKLSSRSNLNRFFEDLLAQKSRVTDVQDALLHDYCPIENEEILMVTVHDVVGALSKVSPQQNDVHANDMHKLFMSRYFPHIRKWGDFFNDRLDLIAEGKHDRQVIKDYVSSENDAIALLDTAESLKSTRSAIVSLLFEVELGPDSLGEAKIDLEKIFDHLEVDQNLILITQRGNAREIPARHKLKKDMQIFVRDIPGLKQWLNPTDESGKINTLTMRFKAIDDLDATFTLTLLNSGAYKMNLKWATEEKASIKDVSNCFHFAKNFIERKILPTPYLIDRSDRFSLPLPCSPFVGTCDSISKNVVIKNMHQKVFFPVSRDFSYHELKKLAYCFKPYITVSSETGEISSFWARFPRSNTIIAKLVEKDLYNLPALSELTSKEWQRLQLFADVKANTQYVEEFRNKVNSLTTRKIIFYFARHSKNNNPNVYKKIINDFINPRKLNLRKLGEDPVQVQALLKEISQRLGMSKKDAFEVYQEYINGDDVDLTSPKVSTGPKCELKKKNGQLRLTITNLRDYTRKSSISFLSKLITNFFQKFIKLYEDDNVDSFCAKNSLICSSSHIEDIQIETALENTMVEDDDDFDFDFDYDLQAHKPVREMETVPEKTLTTTDVPSTRLDNSLKAMEAPAVGKSRLDTLKLRDKEIFTSTKRPGFASRCKVKRQPIILTEEEYRAQDKTAFKIPAALPDGFKYRGYYYICPEFWCPRLGRAVHAKDLHDITWNYTYDNGVTIPSVTSARCSDGELAMVATDGVSGWKADGLGGRFEYPGFLTDHFSDEDKGVPCCFGSDQSIFSDTATFFSLLNGSSKLDQEKSAKPTSQRYRLGPNKTPIEKGRYGKLIPNLDIFFNGDIDPLQKIYDEKFNRFLRLGIGHDNNSFLNALMAVVNNSPLKMSFRDTAAFRTYIAANITDDLLFRSLKNGNLKIIFEDYPGDDYLAKFRRYVEFEENIESEYLWDLFCRPLPWLFPDGLNLFLLAYNVSEDDAILKCPIGEIITNFYHPSKNAAFIVTDGKYYEPIVQLNNALDHKVIFPPKVSYARLEKHFHECKGRPPGTMIPSFVLERLLQKGSTALQPKLQIVNTYNKVRYIVTQNNSIIPVEQGFGPVHQFSIPLGAISEMPQMSYAHFMKILPEFVRIFYPDCQPEKVLLDEDGKPAALRLGNDFVVPVRFPGGKTPYPVDELWLFRELDDDIFDRPYFVDERVKLVSEFYFLRESLERYRHELASFLRYDINRTVDGKIRKKYLLRMKSVVDAKDKAGNPLPIWAKRSLMEDVFFKPANNSLVDEIIDTRKESTNVDYTLQTRRTLCASGSTSHQTTCDASPHCTWRKGCKLYLPKKYVSTFTMLIIEELLRDTVGREMIFENRLETLIKSNRIEVKANHILFDDTVANYVLDIMEKFDLRKQKEKSFIDYLEPSSVASRSYLQNLKKNILFRGFMKFPQQPLGVQAKLIPVESSQKNTLFYTAVSNSLYNTAAYVISDVMNKPQFDSDQLRQDIVRFLKKKHGWQSYLKNLNKIGSRYVGYIRTFSQLAKFIEESDWGGSVVDVDVISEIYPIDFKIIGKSMRGSSGNGPVVKLFPITPFDIRLVYQKIETTLSFHQREV